MKIVGKSNHDSETMSDYLVCENISAYYGEKFVALLNQQVDDDSDHIFVLEANDYVLYTWEP